MQWKLLFKIKSLEIIITFFTNRIFSRSCYQHSFPVLSENLFVSSTLSQITASFKFQLFQIPASSGNYYFKLRQILASSNSGSHRRPLSSGCEKFWLLQFLKNSSFSRFQLQKIPASPNSGFLRRPILK